MGYKTDASIDIAAPPAKVWEWITDRKKLELWTGMDSPIMPEDSSQLKVGYHGKGQFQAPDGMRDVELEVTKFDAPHEFGFRETYAGGGSTASYTLTEAGSGTHLETKADTDMAAAAGIPEQTQKQMEEAMKQQEEAIKKQPLLIRMFAHHFLHKAQDVHGLQEMMNKQVAQMKDSESPMFRLIQHSMQKSTEQSLEQLKKHVEEMG